MKTAAAQNVDLKALGDWSDADLEAIGPRCCEPGFFASEHCRKEPLRIAVARERR